MNRSTLGSSHTFGSKSIFSNTIWLTLDKLIRLGVGFFVGVWVARYLGPEKFGLLNYSAAWVGLFGAFATLGMDGIVVRDIVKAPKERGKLLGTCFALRIGGSVLLVIVSLGVALAVDGADGKRHLIVGIIAASQLFRPFDAIDLWFQAIVKWKNVFWARNFAFLFSTVIRIALVMSGAELSAFAWMFVADAAMTAACLTAASFISRNKSGKWIFDATVAAYLLKSSWPLALSAVAIVIYTRVDQVMIGRILNDENVGIYSAAVRLSEIWYFFPVAAMQSFFPSLVQAKNNNEPDYWKRLLYLNTLLLWLSVIVAVTFQLLSSWMVVLLFGAEYSAAAPILRIHCWAGLFVVLGVVSGQWYVIENLQRIELYKTVAGAVTNVILNLFLIKFFGAIGAAWATIISQMLAAFLMAGFIPRARPIFRVMIKAFFPFLLLRRSNVSR